MTDNDTEGNNYAYQIAEAISVSYNPYHTTIELFFCTLGVALNIITIIIFLRKEMRSQTNSLLLGISIADLMTMATYLVYEIICNLENFEEEETCRYFNCIAIIILSSILIGAHTSAALLTTFLSAFRFYVLYKTSQKSLLKMMVNVMLVISTLFGILMCLPNFGIYSVNLDEGGVNYTLDNQKGNRTNYVDAVYFMVYGCLIKLITCALIIIFTIFIVITLFQTKKRQVELCKRNGGTETSKIAQEKLRKKMRQSHRTTVMLTVVTICFFISEAPQGVINVLVPILGEAYRNNFYVKIGKLLDIMSIINSCCTFFLYCTMSKQFKEQFRKVFMPCLKPKEPENDNIKNTITCRQKFFNMISKNKRKKEDSNNNENPHGSRETLPLNNVRKAANENGYLLINPNADQNSIASMDL